ncbi:MAG: sugar ABC transporter substrate-binding protein [Candidatus Sericytochromatia bacterium]|nr:sugar ABC transporter substrate-binding protein [Candidatus Sericytochromatia bacterium]
MQARARIGLIALAGVFGAALGASAAPVTVSLTGWGGPEEKLIVSGVVAAFERTHPGIKVRYTQIPGVGFDYYNKVRLMIVAGISPDVYYVPDGNFGELASRHVLLNLDPWVAKSKVIRLADIWPSSLKRFRWDGHRLQAGSLYCLPKDIGPNVMFYNKDVLRKRGIAAPDPKVPMTWDQAIAVWKRLSFKDNTVNHYGISGYPYESAVWSSGGEIISPDKRTWALASAPGIRAIQWCADLGLIHKVAPDGSKSGSASPGQLFESQLAAMHVDGRWMVPRYRSLGFDWDVAPLPIPVPGRKSIMWSGSVGFGIDAKTKHPEAAFQLVEYLAGPDGQTAMTKSGLQVPNQMWLAQTDVFRQPGQRPAHPEVFLDSALTSRPGPWTDTPNTFWHDVFFNFIGKVWRGERTARGLLPEISPMVNQAMRENNPEAFK